MELYYAPGTIALASLIALNEAGVPFTTRRIDFTSTEQQSPQYLAVNPKGRVPALITPNGTLTETLAMLAYIATLNPEKQLAPEDSYVFAKMQEFNSYLATTVHINHAHRMRGPRWANEQSSFDDMAAKVPETMHAAFQMIEDMFFVGPWVMGAQYTVADAYLYTIGKWLKGDQVDIADFPKVAQHTADMETRPAVKAAKAMQA